MKAVEELKLALYEAFQAFRGAYPHLSLRAIALCSGVNRYFLTKLEKKEESGLDLEPLLVLTRFLAMRQKSDEPTLKKLKDTAYRLFQSELMSVETAPDSYQQVDLYDPNIYFVLVLSSFRRGTPRDHVKELLGGAGENVAIELLKRKLIYQSEKGRLHLTEGEDFTTSLKLLIYHAPRYFNFYQFGRVQKGRNAFHLFAEGLSMGAFKELQEMHMEFGKRVAAHVSNPKNFGDIGCFSVGCFDSFLENLPTGEKKS